MGNPLLSDDAVGIYAVKQIQETLDPQISEMVCFKENLSGNLDLLDDLSGFRQLLLVDSLETDDHAPGTLLFSLLDDAGPLLYSGYTSIHGLNLPTLFRLGRRLGYMMPDIL